MARFLLAFFALSAFGSGVLNLLSLLGGPGATERADLIRELFPLDFEGIWPATACLATGLILIMAAYHLWRRKRRAYQVVAALATFSILFHFNNGLDEIEGTFSIFLIAGLWLTRRQFRVLSNPPRWRALFSQIAYTLGVAFAYGVAGFWLLDPREFGINFHWWDASLRTLRYLALVGDPSLVPRTEYAGWFLNSLEFTSLAALIWIVVLLFRPVVWRFREAPEQRALARRITERWGRSTLDFFKLWPDKSYFFSESGRAFLAYRVGARMALVLGDPVGPEEEIEPLVRAFVQFCDQRGWSIGFHQVYPDRLPLYRSLGFRHVKIGDDAIVDLTQFSLEGPRMRALRKAINRLQREGVSVQRFDAPIAGEVIEELREVSDEWLRLPGHRERRFTLGLFDEEYLRQATVYAAVDGGGKMLAFLNLIPAHQAGVASADLMRRRPGAPNGVMDYIFAALFQELKEQGVERFNLGLAPMPGCDDGDAATGLDRALCFLAGHTSFLFNFQSLRQFKAKYASHWEPRFALYRRAADLPRFALALRAVSELGPQGRTA
jgi:phosphatidylglycerol lysyltransferase